MSDRFDAKRFAWARSGFDFEGILGAFAAWLVGVLLGMIFSPFFWLGVIAAVLILFATRRANRTTPSDLAAVVAPVDGVVVSVETASVPSELRLGWDDAIRIRIASSPVSQNSIFTPISGEIETLIMEVGAQSQPIAMSADALGLHQVFLSVLSTDHTLGLRIASGGLGPRVDMDVEASDVVHLGGRIGKRRLGGWCDVYLPEGQAVMVAPGMTLVAGETRLLVGQGMGETVSEPSLETTAPEPTTTPETLAAASAPVAAATQAPAASTPPAQLEPEPEPEPELETPATSVSETPIEAVETVTESVSEETDDGEDDPSEMFERLRSKVEEAAKKDTGS